MKASIRIGKATVKVQSRAEVLERPSTQHLISEAIRSEGEIHCQCTSTPLRLVAVRVSATATPPTYWLRRYRTSDGHSRDCPFGSLPTAATLPSLYVLAGKKRSVSGIGRRNRPRFRSQASTPEAPSFNSLARQLLIDAHRLAWVYAFSRGSRHDFPVGADFCRAVLQRLSESRDKHGRSIDTVLGGRYRWVGGSLHLSPDLCGGPNSVVTLLSRQITPHGYRTASFGCPSDLLLEAIPLGRRGLNRRAEGPYFFLAILDNSGVAQQIRLLPVFDHHGVLAPVDSHEELLFAHFLAQNRTCFRISDLADIVWLAEQGILQYEHAAQIRYKPDFVSWDADCSAIVEFTTYNLDAPSTDRFALPAKYIGRLRRRLENYATCDIAQSIEVWAKPSRRYECVSRYAITGGRAIASA